MESDERLVVGDCVPLLKAVPDASVDLAFSDPPFNIGFEYDLYEDKKKVDDYLGWCREWLSEVKRVLTPTGTFWLAIGDAFASELDLLCRRGLGFHRRSWCVWHYTFGVNCERKFTPSKANLFHYVVDPEDFTFNGDAIKVPSARQLVYKDKRAKSGGRLPNDVWALLPQKAEGLFSPEADVWFYPRVCGTFKERVDHPCQMPLAVLDRIIAVSSNPGDLVLDPFVGSGTTLVSAKRLGREYQGFELSPAYAAIARARLAATASPVVRQEQELAHAV
jgi:site-specific DNA-methyltransferase (adenine-specific)